jgi:CRISPR type I-D-associated protein Csc2
MERLKPYLADLDRLTETVEADKPYVSPKRKELGVVSMVFLREAIAPVVFRNAEAEITDIDIAGEPYVRAVPNKFKYPERSRGLQVLRMLELGGRYPQNKTVLCKGQKASAAYDLNTLVFGDSVTQEGRILPVKAAVSYSDALSLVPKHLCVDETFHNRAMEDGTLFDAEDKKNSENLFTRHFIKPGTLLVQVLSTRGRVLPLIGLEHLMLCVGLAGAYGGQTSVTGTNLRTHVAGVYADPFERALDSPYELLKGLMPKGEEVLRDVKRATEALHELLKVVHKVSLAPDEATQWVQGILHGFEEEDPAQLAAYRDAAPKVAQLFDGWFE